MVTRLISVIPSVAVAIAVGRSGINQMLVASQVMLSIVLPFIVFPLVWLCSDKNVMEVTNHYTEEDEGRLNQDDDRARGDESETTRNNVSDQDQITPDRTGLGLQADSFDIWLSNDSKKDLEEEDPGTPAAMPAVQADEAAKPKSKVFTSHWIITTLGYTLWAVVVVANSYVLVMLMMDK